MDAIDTQKATFASGATSTSKKPRYDLIPLVALRRLADRFGYGARKHGDHNYTKGFNDPDFLRDRKNHMLEHVVKYTSGDRSTDHLGAIMCNAAMLAELERIAEMQVTREAQYHVAGSIPMEAKSDVPLTPATPGYYDPRMGSAVDLNALNAKGRVR